MAPLTASTNTTRPTSETTYLANRPSRRNQILSLTPIIQTLGRIYATNGCGRAVSGVGRVNMVIPAGACLAQFEGYRRASAGVVSADPPQYGAISGAK